MEIEASILPSWENADEHWDHQNPNEEPIV